MLHFLNKIRQPIDMPLSKKFLYSFLLLTTGVILGVVSKVLDTTPSNYLPYVLQVLDLGNFFSSMGIWIFIAVVISVYSKTPIRSAINVFLFFVGMVSSYYLYTVFVAGFFPKSYMMIWIFMTCISPFLAFVCWYAKGKGIIALAISSIIFMFISRQAFVFGFWYFDLRSILDFLLWIAAIFVLYQSPKQIIQVVSIGLLLFLLTAQVHLFMGLL